MCCVHYELGLLTVSSVLPMLVPRLCVVAPECIFVTATRTPSALVRLARVRSLERLRDLARWCVAASVLGYDDTGHDVRFFFVSVRVHLVPIVAAGEKAFA